MLVRELLAQHEDKTNLIRRDLFCLSGFSVDVLQSEAVQREMLARYHDKQDFDKRLQFLGLLYISKAHVSNKDKVEHEAELLPKRSFWSFALLLKMFGIALSLTRTMLRGRSAKLQQVLLRYSMMIYYAVFRVSSLIR